MKSTASMHPAFSRWKTTGVLLTAVVAALGAFAWWSADSSGDAPRSDSNHRKPQFGPEPGAAMPAIRAVESSAVRSSANPLNPPRTSDSVLVADPAVPGGPDPTIALAQVVPQLARLGRHDRDPQAAASREALAMQTATPVPRIRVVSDNGQGSKAYRDPQGRAGSADLAHATVSASDLELPFYPQGQVLAAAGSRVSDPTAGNTVSATVLSADPPLKVADFYRAQLGGGRGETPVVEDGDAAGGVVVLTTASSASGVSRSVTILRDGSGSRVILTRSNPPLPAMPGR